MISRKSSVLIFGEYCDESDSSLIAQYNIDRWERIGNLQNSRQSHRAIANQDRIYIVGGEGVLYVFSDQIFKIIHNIIFSKTEIWSHDENDNTFNMKFAEPNLNNYRYYPELFIVDSDFCTKK